MEIRPEVAAPSPECPNPSRWSCYDGMATEVEVIELLAAFVRALKPAIVVETGTYKGICTVALAQAARANGFGHVFTAEPDTHFRDHALALAQHSHVQEHISFYAGTGEEMIAGFNLGPIDFAFLDSSAEGRVPELRLLEPKLSARAIVAVHDTHNRPDSLRHGLYRFADAHGFRYIQFDTPRGLTLLRR